MNEKIMNTTNEFYTLKNAPLSLINDIADVIVKSLFRLNKEKTEQTYLPQNRELITIYTELLGFYPEKKFNNMSLEEFFDSYVEGKYDDIIRPMKENRRIQYLDRITDYVIETKLRYDSGAFLVNSVTKFIQNLTETTQKFGDFKTDDIQNFFKGFSNLSENINAETLAEAVIKLHQKEDKKPKKTRKTAQETVNTAQ